MPAKLWTINALATELERDRAALGRALSDLEPDSEEVAVNGGTSPKWRLSRVFSHLSGSGEKLDGNAERARKDKEAADKLALENAQTRGDLASISVMAKSFADAVVTTKALLMAIPTKEARTIAAMNDANAVEHRLRNTINDALRQLSAYGTERAGERGAGNGAGDGDVRAAAASNGKRVGRGKQATQ